MSNNHYIKHKPQIDLVLEYFRQKSHGMNPIEIPPSFIFDHVITLMANIIPVLSLSCERELRAIYLNVGKSLTAEQCTKLLEYVNNVGNEERINRLYSELDSINEEIEYFQREANRIIEQLDELEAEDKPLELERELIRCGA